MAVIVKVFLLSSTFWVDLLNIIKLVNLSVLENFVENSHFRWGGNRMSKWDNPTPDSSTAQSVYQGGMVLQLPSLVKTWWNSACVESTFILRVRETRLRGLLLSVGKNPFLIKDFVNCSHMRGDAYVYKEGRSRQWLPSVLETWNSNLKWDNPRQQQSSISFKLSTNLTKLGVLG